MNYDKNQVHYVTATVILVNKEGRFLIARRSEKEKAFPGLWTVPGGKLEVLDYVMRKKDTSVHWYNVLEDLAKREVLEEVGLGIKNIEYVTSLVYIRSDNIPSLIISLWAEPVWEVLDGHDSGEPKIKLCPALTDYKWVTLEEAKNYDLIEGIYEELEILDKNLRRSAYTLKGTSPKNLNEGARIGKNMEWKKREEEGKMDEWGKILDDGADMEWKKREEELFWGN
ncbi:MAG: NUDIX domain-containing protein [Nanoarchaeota archaeon]|nr:NUDIX domain-containing protein [Nanoarchaeota archaeon]